MKRYGVFVSALVIGLFVLGFILPQISIAVPTPVPNVEVWCIWADDSMGTGTLIRGTNGTVVLFDEGGAPTWAGICKDLMDDQGISTIHYAIGGHYDRDHVDGMAPLNDLLGGDSTRGYAPNIDNFYDRGGTTNHAGDPIRTDYYDLVSQSGKRHTVVVNGDDDIDLGSGAMLYFLSVGEPNTTDELNIRGGYTVTDDITENNKSISALLSVSWMGGYYGNYFDMYLGSDLEGTGECAVDDVIIGNGALDLDAEVDVMLVDHHGSDSNYITSTEFLDTIEPEVAIISVWSNSNEHPRYNTVQRLQQVVEADTQRIIRLDPGDDTPPNSNWAPETMAYCHTTNSHVYIWTNGAYYSIEGTGIDDDDLHYHPVDEGTQYPPTPPPE